MALGTNFNVNPYHDDFDEDKKFLRMLFKPGFAVQARELTQLQTLLQKQVDRFGQHVFKNGSNVLGCQTVVQEATYINLSSSYASTDIVANNFVGQTILSIDESKRAEVIKVYEADSGTSEPITLMVKQVYGNTFSSSETIKTNELSPSFANTTAVGTGQTFSVNEGVFFFDGFFIKNSAQTIALSKYSNTTANVKVGFEVTESIVTSSADTSLLDPAQDASNYQAPGSDRFKINLVLATRSLDSTDLERFIELARVEKAALTRDYKYPIYSVIEDTLARRTFDESGNYTVRPFKISLQDSSNTANADIILSPGKAYVYGYEVETISPTTIVVPKPRESTNVNNKRLNADFGNSLYTKDHFNVFPINSLITANVHCVSNASVNLTSSGTISNTKIGTVRIKAVEYDSSSNTANGQTYGFRTYIFDANIGSITGSVNTATSNTVSIGNTIAGQIYTSITDAYAGAKLRITSGLGSSESSKTITAFNAATQILTLESSFATVPNSASIFAIDFELNDAESIVIHNGLSCTSAANIDIKSKDLASDFDDVVTSDAALEPLIFPLGQDYIKEDTISDMIYSYRRLYTGNFSANSISISVNDAATENFASGSTTTQKLENYHIVCTSAAGSYNKGDVIPVDRISVSGSGTSTATISVTNAINMGANIVVTIDTTNQVRKDKTFVTANSTIQNTGGESVNTNGAIVHSTKGQTIIQANNVIKTPGVPQTLYVSDVDQLIQVLDFRGANVANTGGTDITARYSLEKGQKDSFYDHSSITLKPGNIPAQGPLAVRYNRYTSSGPGFFTVDSYPTYETISTYSSPTTGVKYELRDAMDFRPVRLDATAALGTGTFFDVSTIGTKIPKNGSSIDLDYSYYLPRVDKLVLNKDKTFEVIRGISSLQPLEPKEKDGSMTMYLLINPAYVSTASDIDVRFIENKRYTMRDIGTIEKRVDNLEYYTSLSLLEQDTLNKQDLTILDSTNLPRFKNGILTDGFKGHSVAAVTLDDFAASIDTGAKELRPTFNISSHLLTFNSANSTNYLQSGPFITASSSSTAFIDQALASRFINVNPFNVISYLGKIILDPASDVWIDTQQRPDVLVNIGGNQDAWDRILSASGLSGPQMEWNSWQTKWTGTPAIIANEERIFEQTFAHGVPRRILDRTTVSQSTGQSRTGISTRISVDTVTQRIGDRIVDISVIPYMRNRNILFVGTDFKPDTTLYSFFDSTLVEKYVAKANRFNLTTNNLTYKTVIGEQELVTVRNAATSAVLGTALAVRASNNSLYVVSVNPSAAFNAASMTLTGNSTGLSKTLSNYEHYTGQVQSSTSSTIVLRQDASGSITEQWYANTSNCQIVFIVSGTGAGQSATISSYNAGTRTLTISGAWSTTPDATSVYSIGRPTSTRSGDVAGIFFIPTGLFRVGEKRFRFVDNITGDLGSSATNGDASFYAQGTLQTKEETIISTLAPQIQRASVAEERVVTQTTTQERVVGYWDPLAQTFLVAPTNFPQGVFVDKIRVCFKSKDDTVPITCQIRPAVNGYPSSSVVYPYASVSVTPDKINITDSPSLDTVGKFTDITFDTPVYLQPGEHSFVLMANSNKYEIYIAEIGKLDMVGGKQISEQPYGGSLFLSQNGSTWTADQNADMMFRLFRKEYSLDPVTCHFTVNYPSSNTVYDLMQMTTGQIVVANTSLNFNFSSEKTTGGLTGFNPIIPFINHDMALDGQGRRVLNPATGNNTMNLKATMATLHSSISPILDVNRFSIITVENIINNMPLLNTGFVIENGGSGYTGNTSVTITGGNGSAANAYAVVANGNVTSIIVDNAGLDYSLSPTITIAAPPVPSGNTTATVSYNGEDKKSGGNAVARYITRKITLADGFDSGDLRVYMTAYKPAGSKLYVYYKILSASDNEVFDNKNYQLMTQLDNVNFVSANDGDIRELSFAPGVNNVANNSVSYTTSSTAYSKFKTFAIKVVISGTSTIDVPRIRDLRAIALPAG